MIPKQLPCLLLGAALALAGCSPSNKQGEITGVVKFKGEPLPGGTVVFHGATSTYTSEIRKDGNYTVSGVPLGTAKIAVVMPIRITMGGKSVGSNSLPDIPARYGDPQKSGLSCEVTGGSQTHNVELSGD
jgi:hypothetical protein